MYLKLYTYNNKESIAFSEERVQKSVRVTKFIDVLEWVESLTVRSSFTGLLKIVFVFLSKNFIQTAQRKLTFDAKISGHKTKTIK